MALPKPDVVIFDMDGTSVRHINPRLLHILEWLDDTHFKISRFFARIIRRGKPTDFSPDVEFTNTKKPKLLVHRAIHKFRRKSVEKIVEPCPGVSAVLGLLRRHKVPLGLASNGLGKGYGHDILQKFDLEQYFKVTIFREDIQKSKPNPEGILLAIQKMEITPKEKQVIWYIGDRHKDVKAAIAANDHVSAKIIPIAYGLNAAVAVLENGLPAESIIMSYYDMYMRLIDFFDDATQPETKKSAA